MQYASNPRADDPADADARAILGVGPELQRRPKFARPIAPRWRSAHPDRGGSHAEAARLDGRAGSVAQEEALSRLFHLFGGLGLRLVALADRLDRQAHRRQRLDHHALIGRVGRAGAAGCGRGRWRSACRARAARRGGSSACWRRSPRSDRHGGRIPGRRLRSGRRPGRRGPRRFRRRARPRSRAGRRVRPWSRG